MREINNPKTNAQHLVNAVVRAQNEDMQIFVNGDVTSNGFIVVNNGVGYIVSTNKDGEISGCTCPHCKFRNVICKHQIKVALEHGLSIAELPEVTSRKKEITTNNDKVTQLR